MIIKYINNAGDTIDFTKSPYKMLSDTDLFNFSWGNLGKQQLSRTLTDKKVNVVVDGISFDEYEQNIDYLHEVTEYDVINKIPGRLYVGNYYLDCYISSSEKNKKYTKVKRSVIGLTVSPDSKVWIKETRHDFIYSQSTDESGRGYEYGYEYDYAMSSGNTNRLKNEHFAPCHFVMKISGYASTPSITIGDHIYRVHETIQNNEILTIDSKKKTITLTKNNGVQVNLFSKRDKESYIFEKIPSGDLNVYWNSEFNFEVTLYEERGEPKWT